MKGFHNHYLIENFPFLGEYETVETFHLIGAKSKAFPYITSYKMSDSIPFTRVKGELYNVSNEVIQRLDNLEGHPAVYTRRSIEVTDGTRILNVSCYILDNRELAEQLKNNLGIRFDSIPSGNWRDFN